MKFRYTGAARSGAHTDGIVEAADKNAARDLLRRDGVIVLSIEETSSDARAGSGVNPRRTRSKRVGTGKRLKRVCMLARQLQVLLGSGTPILQSLSALQRQGENEDWRSVLGDVHKRLEEGSPLSEALRTHPEYFDAVALSLVSAGEASGNMPLMFERLSILTRKQLQLRGAISGALVYPCVLISIGIIVLCVMLLFVLPRFEELFKQIDSPLPPMTMVLLQASHLLREYWWGIFPAIAAALAGVWFGIQRPSVRNRIDAALLRIPKLGRLLTNIATAKLSRMLGTLIDCRVPLLDALDLTRQSLRNVQYIALVNRAQDAVSRGESISSVLSRSDLIAPCVQEAIVHGEASGQLGTPLTQMSDFLDEENDLVVKSITRLIEPLILVILGILVGSIAMSMFLPLFDLVSSANGGH